jgi:hypothetical protein
VNALCRTTLVLAFAGLMLSLVVHFSTLFGLPQSLGEYAWALHGGAMLVFFVALLASRSFASKMSPPPRANPIRWSLWSVLLSPFVFNYQILKQGLMLPVLMYRNCPVWLSALALACHIYAFCACAVIMLSMPVPLAQQGGPTPSIVFCGFSTCWIGCFGVSAAFLYAAINAQNSYAALAANATVTSPRATI